MFKVATHAGCKLLKMLLRLGYKLFMMTLGAAASNVNIQIKRENYEREG